MESHVIHPAWNGGTVSFPGVVGFTNRESCNWHAAVGITWKTRCVGTWWNKKRDSDRRQELRWMSNWLSCEWTTIYTVTHLHMRRGFGYLSDRVMGAMLMRASAGNKIHSDSIISRDDRVLHLRWKCFASLANSPYTSNNKQWLALKPSTYFPSSTF